MIDSTAGGAMLDPLADAAAVAQLIGSFPEVFFLFGRDGRIRRWNRHLEVITGHDGDTILGRQPVDFFPADDRAAVQQAFERALECGEAQVEARLETRSGDSIPHLFSGHRLELGGENLVAGFGIDISKRRGMETALRASEAKYRALVEQSLVGVYTIREGVFSYVNQRLAELFGYEPDQIVDRLGPLDLVAPDYRDYVRERLRERLDGEAHTARYEARGVRRDGSQLWFTVYGTRVELDGDSVIAGVLIDITRRRDIEDRLRENERFLQTLIAHLPGVVYRCANDTDWTLHFISDASREVLGYDRGEMMRPGSPTLGELIHPDDRDYVWREVQSAIAEQRSFRLTYRVRHRTKGDRWVVEQGRAVTDGKLDDIEVEGFITDITEQKRAEDESRRMAEQLTNTLESMTDAFVTLDRELRFTYINREAERVLGHPRTSLLGTDIREAFPELRGTRVEQEFETALRDNRSGTFECCFPDPGVWQEFRVYPSEEGVALYFRDITAARQAQERIEFLARYDQLTELPNRAQLAERLGAAIESSRHTGRKAAVLFLDIDDFKSVNDVFGHPTGDALLQHVANRLRETVRHQDTVARFGGDEFAAIVEDLDAHHEIAIEQAETIAEKVRARLADPYALAEHTRHGSVSIGVAVFDGNELDSDELMQRADMAMYAAKEAGRNTVRVFDPERAAEVSSRVRLEETLRHAIEAARIEVHYQPQVDAEGQVVGAEALARWSTPDRGMISPGEFIPVAEQTGLILPLGRLVLETACRQLATWRARPGSADFTVGVNVSAVQLRDPCFVGEVVNVLERTGAPGSSLRLELTETVLLNDIDATRERMQALQPHGVRFSLDDFGTGYSSLAYLKTLPLDRLKIDQSFVRDMAHDANDAAIVQAVIAIARSLGLGVIAEGVETEEARAMLARYGCRHYQGYLFAAAMPAEDFETFADRRMASGGR